MGRFRFGTTVGRQKYGKSLFGPLDFVIPPFTCYVVGPGINAPLDLFGGNKRALEERAAYEDYQKQELNAAYLSLTANVVAQALAAASARAQIDVVQDIIANDQRNVDLVQTALDDGQATRTQLLTAHTQLATDRTLLPELRQEESTARHALAILVGKQPAEWAPPNGAAAAWSMAANLTAPLYDGGRLRAERRAAVDGYQAALADYRQVILRSFGDVADSLQGLSNDDELFNSQAVAAQAAAAARDLARRSYAVGNSGILDVLDAERSTAQAQLGLSRAKAQRLIDTARLYMALGGTPVPAANANSVATTTQ